eukprot:scaffold762_cov363-Pavlova_lutheri.AAC.4
MQVNLETVLLYPNNRRGSHWIQPRPLDAQGTIGDGNTRCKAFFPIKPWMAAYGAATLSWQSRHHKHSRSPSCASGPS